MRRLPICRRRASRDFVGVQPELSGRRVLVVDDNATNRRVLSLQTAKWGMQVREAESPPEALRGLDGGESLRPRDPRHAHAGDGRHRTRTRRSGSATPGLPLVLFTSLGRREVGRQRGPVQRLPGEAGAAVAAVRHAGQPARPQRVAARSAAPAAAKPKIDTDMGVRHPLRILVAEDNVVNQKLALRVLQQMGYRADLASNGIEADRVGRAPDLRRGADGRADAGDGRTRGVTAHHARSGRPMRAHASSR